MSHRRAEQGCIPVQVSCRYTVELPDGDPPAGGWPLLLALHGMGMRASTFTTRVRAAVPAGVALAAPQAPLPYETLRPDGSRVIRHAWYVYDGDSPEFRARLHRAADVVLQLRTAILAGRPLDPARVALLGFSQGGYLAAVAALRHRAPWCGLSVCAARVKSEMLSDGLRTVADFPVQLVHATDDRSIPADAVARGCEALTDQGAVVTVCPVAGPHAFGDAMASAVRTWLGGLWT